MCDVIEGTESSPFPGRLFLNSVLSAILGLGLLLLIAFYVFVEFFVDPAVLRSDQHFDGTAVLHISILGISQHVLMRGWILSALPLRGSSIPYCFHFILLLEYLCSAGWNVFPYRANSSS